MASSSTVDDAASGGFRDDQRETRQLGDLTDQTANHKLFMVKLGISQP